jgi:hypothetical protein
MFLKGLVFLFFYEIRIFKESIFIPLLPLLKKVATKEVSPCGGYLCPIVPIGTENLVWS